MDISVEDQDKLSEFKELIIIMDYIIESELTRFMENCECDIEVSDDNRKECSCEENKSSMYLQAKKVHDIYFCNT